MASAAQNHKCFLFLLRFKQQNTTLKRAPYAHISQGLLILCKLICSLSWCCPCADVEFIQAAFEDCPLQSQKIDQYVFFCPLNSKTLLGKSPEFLQDELSLLVFICEACMEVIEADPHGLCTLQPKTTQSWHLLVCFGWQNTMHEISLEWHMFWPPSDNLSSLSCRDS